MDNLPREKAFFQGPPPLLLSSVDPADLTFLLLGADPKISQVTMQYIIVCLIARSKSIVPTC